MRTAFLVPGGFGLRGVEGKMVCYSSLTRGSRFLTLVFTAARHAEDQLLPGLLVTSGERKFSEFGPDTIYRDLAALWEDITGFEGGTSTPWFILSKVVEGTLAHGHSSNGFEASCRAPYEVKATYSVIQLMRLV